MRGIGSFRPSRCSPRPGGPFFGIRCALAAVVVAAASLCNAATRTVGTLAEGTRFETLYYVQKSGAPGPTVMVTGGVHGNEPAGACAADQLRHWPIGRGTIIVLPRANVPALAANKRHTPGVPEDLGNLNRNFPKAGKLSPARGAPAEEIWRLVDQFKPDWLVDLHEGFDFHRINPKSVGSNILAPPTLQTDPLVARMLAAVNETIDVKEKQFGRKRGMADGSLARAAHEHLGCKAMILETTRKDQPLSRRARQHRLMVHRLLADLGMIGSSVGVDWITNREDTTGRIRVAMYDAGGTGGKGPGRLMKLLGDWRHSTITRVGVDEIRNGTLAQFDVVIFPGGSGSKQAAALEPLGCKQVRKFVEDGGGYIGICAGAFLACKGFSWGLKILDAKTVSPKWRRGKATVEIELTEAGREVLGSRSGRFQIKYSNGPILMPARSDRLPDYVPLAFFRTEVAENESPKGAMVDSPAIVAGRCGNGRVLCLSPHAEATEGLEQMICRAVQWAAGKETGNR